MWSGKVVESVLDLPAELQEHVFSYCSMSDLQSLSRVNKHYYHTIQHLLWREIDIPWKTIQKEAKLPKKLEKLKLARQVSFIDDTDTSDAGGPKPTKWVHVAGNYKKVLKNCNRNYLKSVRVMGLAADNGVKTICHLLVNLRELHLGRCHYTTIIAWQTLAAFKPLRKLTIEDCRIYNVGIKTICESPYVTNLVLINCQLITDPSMESIGTMANLKKLSVLRNRNITAKGLRSLVKLRNLDCLNLEYKEVDENGVSCLCHLTIGKERVDLQGSHQLTAKGFYEFPTPPGLELQGGSSGTSGTENQQQQEGEGKALPSPPVVATIQEDKLPRVAMDHYRKMKEMEQDMKYKDLVLHIDTQDMKNGTCKLNWKCTSIL